MDKIALKVVLFSFIAILVFNVIIISSTEDPNKLGALTNLNLPVIGVITLIVSLYRGKKDADDE